MAGVFISYRRDDSKGFAGALMRDLDRRLGAEQVFMDIEDIQGGTDFPAVLRRAVQSSDVLLALIGSRWLEARDAQGNRRLDDPTEKASKRLITVVVDPDNFGHYLMDLSFLKCGPRPQARDL